MLKKKILLSFLVFAVPIAVAYHGNYLTGAFEHGDLALAVGMANLRPGETAHVFVAVDPQTELDDVVIFPANLIVRNNGNKLLSNVLLSLAYDKRSHYTAIDLEPFETYHGALTKNDSAHEHNSSDDTDYSNFTRTTLNIRSSLTFKDGAQFYQDVSPTSLFEMTLLRSEVKASLQADNVQRMEYALSYHGVRANNCSDLVQRYKDEYAKYAVIVKREETPFFVYLGHLMYSRDTTGYLICPTYRSVVVGGKRTWIPVGNDETMFQLSFKPYLWSLLFDTPKPAS